MHAQKMWCYALYPAAGVCTPIKTRSVYLQQRTTRSPPCARNELIMPRHYCFWNVVLQKQVIIKESGAEVVFEMGWVLRQASTSAAASENLDFACTCPYARLAAASAACLCAMSVAFLARASTRYWKFVVVIMRSRKEFTGTFFASTNRQVRSLGSWD